MKDSQYAEVLLAWYDANKRALPWRMDSRVGQVDVYRVWVSEIMLQQTTVETVKGYYGRFIERWQTVDALASAERDEVLLFWQGLGYYRRAHGLHEAARKVVAEHKGVFPRDDASLRALPGIGAYTSAALRAIAFGEAVLPLDGNIKRILARLLALNKPVEREGRTLEAFGQRLVPRQRSGDFAQAMMDLGATICLPRQPRCGICPYQKGCLAYRKNKASAYPYRAPKKERPHRYAVFFWIENEHGAYWLEKRPEKGLLAGLMICPSTPWRDKAWGKNDWRAYGDKKQQWQMVEGHIVHVFTHFTLHATIAYGRSKDRRPTSKATEGVWVSHGKEKDYALSTLMRKVIAHKYKQGAP
ncbi:MAG: A/G-specific adenine glycosylase [Alphaproteobacteria bacterium GM202ARS2]|nr:A/G-specific adenine glycosylase [Alphaproteobacteria bacterium GM202ARS2]